MDQQLILKELETLGSAQTRKTYRRHGIGENMYGVSYGNLKTLKKKLKTNHELAQHLWATGNHDARVLATMIADPKQMDEATLEAWVHDLDNHVITDAFVSLASKAPLAPQKAAEWSRAPEEQISRAGWHLLGSLAQNNSALADDFFEPYLEVIEQNIHQQQNRVREAMNNTLIAMGSRNSALQEKALAVAQKIGEVYVDHGETACKTPEAIPYIEKTVQRKKEKGQWN
jgi:3-methyladenine DNA glycosylase AlkD